MVLHEGSRALLTVQSVLPAWHPVLLGFAPWPLACSPSFPSPCSHVLPAQPAQGVLAEAGPVLHSCQGEPVRVLQFPLLLSPLLGLSCFLQPLPSVVCAVLPRQQPSVLMTF